jgi:hypothetical protein
MYIDIWSSLILGIIIINIVNSMLRIYYTTKCISNNGKSWNRGYVMSPL